MEFVHVYLGSTKEGQMEYNCTILNKEKRVVGNCKYYKNDESDDIVFIEFINIGYEHRRRGYATSMVKELNSKYTLKWDGRFSEVGKLWYNSLLKSGIISEN
jgi:hypothetical protein